MEWDGEGVAECGGGRHAASADPAGLALEARLGGGNGKGRGGPRPATSPPPPRPGLRAGSGGQQGAPEDRHCLAEDLPGFGRCPARDPRPTPAPHPRSGGDPGRAAGVRGGSRENPAEPGSLCPAAAGSRSRLLPPGGGPGVSASHTGSQI